MAEFFLIFYQSAGRTRECVGKSKLFSYTCRKIFHLCQNNEHFKKHVQENFLRIADNSKKEEHMQETSYMCHIKWKYEEHMQENFLHVWEVSAQCMKNSPKMKEESTQCLHSSCTCSYILPAYSLKKLLFWNVFLVNPML